MAGLANVPLVEIFQLLNSPQSDSSAKQQAAAHLAQWIIEGLSLKNMITIPGGAEAITTLLSMQQHAPPGCPPLQLATLGNQILTISQTVSIGLSYLEADDADAVMANVTAPGSGSPEIAVRQAVEMLSGAPVNDCDHVRHRPVVPGWAGNPSTHTLVSLHIGAQQLKHLSASSAAARAAVLSTAGAAQGLAKALVHGGNEACMQAISAISSTVSGTQPSEARTAFACELVRPLLAVVQGLRVGSQQAGESSASTTAATALAAAECLVTLAPHGLNDITPAVVAELARHNGLKVLTEALKVDRLAVPAAQLLQMLFRSVPSCKGDPVVAKVTLPVLTKRLEGSSSTSTIPECCLAAGKALLVLLYRTDDVIPGFDANKMAALAARLGTIASTAVLCCNEATLRVGAMLMSLLFTSSAVLSMPPQQLQAAAPAVVPLLKALQQEGAKPEVTEQQSCRLSGLLARLFWSFTTAGLQRQLLAAGADEVLLSVGAILGGCGRGIVTDTEAADALAALRSLIMHSDKAANEFAERGGTMQLARLLLNRDCGPLTAEVVCNIMATLAGDYTTSPMCIISHDSMSARRRSVIAGGGLVACLKALRGCGAQMSAEAAFWAMLALRELCGDAGCRAAVKELGGIDAAASWSTRPGSDQATQPTKAAAAALQQLLETNGEVDSFAAVVLQHLTSQQPELWSRGIPVDIMPILRQLMSLAKDG